MGCKLSCCEANVTPAVDRRNKGYSFPANLPKVVGLTTDHRAIFPAGNNESVIKSQKMPSSQELNVSCNLQHISEREPDDCETDPSTSPTAAPLFMRMSRSDVRLGKDRSQTQFLNHRPLKKSSSCSTIFLDDSTVSHPHLKNTIKCVSLAIYYHIKNNSNVIKEEMIQDRNNLIAGDDDNSLEIFDERLHPLTVSNSFLPGEYKSRRKVLVPQKEITMDSFGDMNEPDQKTIYRFVRTLFNAAQLPPECAIITLVYLERLLTYAETKIGPNTWKRMVLGSILLASKVWDDQAVWNVDYCQILRDIPVEDMNELERKFLELLQFNINVPSSVYAKYYFDLRSLADKNGLSLPFQQLSRGRAVKLEAVSKLTDYELIEFWRTGQRKWSSMESLKLVSKARFNPRPLVICGPSGSGKSTLLRRLMSEFNDYLGFSISHTTRNPRQGEIAGKDYHYTTVEKMMKAIEAKEFIEYTQFSGNYYGTSKKAVNDVQDQGKICILDVEIEGVKNLKKTDLSPRFVFIRPPGSNIQETLDILRQRLKGRQTESDEAIEKRLAQAEEELVYGSVPGNFDLVLFNDDVDQAYQSLRNFILPDVEQLRNS